MDTVYIDKVKSWLALDNQSLRLKEEMEKKTEKLKLELDTIVEGYKQRMDKVGDEKKELEEDILKYVETNALEKMTLSLSDGSLKFTKKSTQQSVSLKYLKTTLGKYSEEKEAIDAEDVYKYLVSNLETKTKLSMKREVK